MKKLTNKQTRRHAIKIYVALMRCWEMWDELYKTGGNDKSDTTSYQRYRTGCWACALCVSCNKCMMIELWPGSCICGKTGYFGKWENAETPKTRRKYAKIIAEFAIQKAARIKALHNIQGVNWEEYKI